MTKLSPSILSADFAALGSDCRRVLDAGADMLHFDVMDGHFVPNISFGLPVLKSLHEAFPDTFMDVHLMISHPLDYVDAFAKAGAGGITFHLESEDDPAKTIAAIRAAGCKVGLAIKPGTSPELVCPYLDKLDLVLVMTVEPGFGGQKFMPEMLEKITIVKGESARRGLAPTIQVDGGVSLSAGTAAQCTEAGATLLVAGSAVFGVADPAGAVAAFRAL